MKYAYYPGCSLHSTAKEYDISTKAVAKSLGIELVEINDWTCCGATPAHLTMHTLATALPVKNLLAAQKMELSDVVTACAACFSRLKISNKMMQEDKKHRAKVNEVLNDNYNGDMKVQHFLDVITNTFGLKNIAEKVTKKLSGLKVACYYGCLLTRPHDVTEFDDLEDPHLMDDLMKVLGAEAVNWPYKVECCGASFSLTKTSIVLKLSGDILQMAVDEGAEAIIVACPLCQSNLDLRQKMINRRYKKKFNVPILYFTQMLGLGLGIEAKDLGFEKHIINPIPLLKEKGIISK